MVVTTAPNQASSTVTRSSLEATSFTDTPLSNASRVLFTTRQHLSRAAMTPDRSFTVAESTIHGKGLIANRTIPTEGVVFEERDANLIVSASTPLVRGRRCEGISTAWSITIHLLQCDDPPSWLATLHRNHSLTKSQLTDEKDAVMLRETMQMHPSKNVIDTFSAVVTNHFCVMDLSMLGAFSSRINHAAEPNVATRFMMDESGIYVDCIALRKISAGEELVISYPEGYALNHLAT